MLPLEGWNPIVSTPKRRSESLSSSIMDFIRTGHCLKRVGFGYLFYLFAF